MIWPATCKQPMTNSPIEHDVHADSTHKMQLTEGRMPSTPPHPAPHMSTTENQLETLLKFMLSQKMLHAQLMMCYQKGKSLLLILAVNSVLIQ